MNMFRILLIRNPRNLVKNNTNINNNNNNSLIQN